MKKITMMVLVAASVVSLTACTDVQKAHWQSIGQEARVTCYSGGKMIFDDFSTGKVAKNSDGGDGYEFMSLTNKRLVQVNGDCVVDYGKQVEPGWKATLP